ncbi:MAG: TolC family protein [Bacteroidota bacterium]
MHYKTGFLIICWSIGLQSIVAKAQKPIRDVAYFLNIAIEHSPVLKDQKNQQQALEIDNMLLLASTKPHVTASSTGMYAPIVKGYGYDEVLSNGQALEALLNVNYELLNKKRTKNELQGIKLQSDSLKQETALSALDLTRSVIDQYITAFAGAQTVKFNSDVLVLLKKEETLLKELTRNNLYKQSEYLTFLVTLQQQQLTLKQAELEYQTDYAALNYLCGISDTVMVPLAEPQLSVQPMPFEPHFFTRKFELDSLKYLNQKQTISLNYKPKLGIYANSGYNSSLMFQPYKNFGASVGFTLSIPIYDGHQQKMRYNKLDLSALTTSTYKNFFISRQKQQLYTISQQLNYTNVLYTQINDQIRFAKGLIAVDSKLLHTGDVKVADYIIAINNYMAAQNLLRQTNISHLRLINQFNYWNK